MSRGVCAGKCVVFIDSCCGVRTCASAGFLMYLVLKKTCLCEVQTVGVSVSVGKKKKDERSCTSCFGLKELQICP